MQRVCSHSFTGALNVVAHAHFLAATPNGWMLEWPVATMVTWAALFPDAPHPVDGVLALPDRPGWGLRPDETVVRRFAMPRTPGGSA